MCKERAPVSPVFDELWRTGNSTQSPSGRGFSRVTRIPSIFRSLFFFDEVLPVHDSTCSSGGAHDSVHDLWSGSVRGSRYAMRLECVCAKRVPQGTESE